MGITKAKAEVYRIIVDVACKLLLVITSILVFLVVTGFLLWKPSWYLVVAESVFAISIGRVILHYFPGKTE